MKKLLLFLMIISLPVLFSGCDDDGGIKGNTRIFDVIPVTNESGWPNREFNAITFTWEVVAQGNSSATWAVSFVTEPNGFTITPDYVNNRFTVSVPKNETIHSRSVTVKVDYGDTWRYLDLTQRSSAFSIEPGANVGGGVYRYTVSSAGEAVFTGEITNPEKDDVSITFKSGMNIFTENITTNQEDGSATLNFSADPWTGFFSVGYKEAVYEVKIAGKPEFDTEIIIRQNGEKPVPAAAIEDTTAPGGFYYKLYNNNIDVAGLDLMELEGKTWDQIFDPEGILTKGDNWATAPTSTVNPCPEGWEPITLDIAKKMVGGTFTINGSMPGSGSQVTGNPANVEGKGGTRAWLMNIDNDLVKYNIFDQGGLGQYYHIMTASIAAAGSKNFARLTITTGADITVSNVGTTQKVAYPLYTGGGSTTWFGVRCVRER
jgi:hypothetical protein